jgi:pyruvate/2-oxoglutarate dehydrogenase complex dihydrolipoamide dehydrogenase (E3) component
MHEYYEQSVEAVQEIREFMRLGNYEALNTLETVDILTGTAVFVDPHSVSVDTGSERLTIGAEAILIDTGAEPLVPDIPGLRESRHTATSTELMETPILPERLAIIGGGYIGLSSPASTATSARKSHSSSGDRRYCPHADDDAPRANSMRTRA